MRRSGCRPTLLFETSSFADPIGEAVAQADPDAALVGKLKKLYSLHALPHCEKRNLINETLRYPRSFAYALSQTAKSCYPDRGAGP